MAQTEAGFQCGICATTHPSIEHDNEAVRIHSDPTTRSYPNGTPQPYSDYLGRQVGWCPVAGDFTVTMADGSTVFTGNVEYNLTPYEVDTFDWLEHEYTEIEKQKANK